MKRSIRSLLPALVAALAVGVSGCALTSKAELVGTRYFTPEVPSARLSAAVAPGGAAAAAKAPELKLGRVTSGAHLRERIAYRDAAYEVGYYEDQQWTERPEIYVRRALGRALFEEHGFRHVLATSAPTLDVEVVAFDELRLLAGRAARVELRIVLSEGRSVLFEETITIDRPASATTGKPRIEDIVAAMAQALDTATEQVAARITAALAQRATAPAP